MSEVLRTERRDGVTILTLHRPDKRNALNLEMVQALAGALVPLAGDPELRAVILTGAGGNFAAGADIAELRERGSAEALASINGGLFRRIEELPVPVIAALEGFALGGGCELALAADLRIGGASVRIGQPEVGLGILPGAGATHRLPRLIGFGRAKELIFTGCLLEAPEAERIGLLNRVVPEGQALSAALEMAATIAAQGATAIRLAKLALNAQRHDVDVSHTLESVAQALLFEGAEKRERMTAFLERKRR